MNLPKSLRWDDQGLIAAIVQDWRDGTVLMLGFMNEEALSLTASTGYLHFWSRSRQKLWKKGETSGDYLLLKEVLIDCDQDALLVKAEPVGAACHTKQQSCFFSALELTRAPVVVPGTTQRGALLERVLRTILDRKAHPLPGSYVSSLFVGGHDRILKKVAEEAGEVLLASKNASREELIHEVADLSFHLLVVLGFHGISLLDVYRELGSRVGKSRQSTPAKEPADHG